MKYPSAGVAGKRPALLALAGRSYMLAAYKLARIKSRCGSIPAVRTMTHPRKSNRPLLGAHESIAGGVGEALIRGQQVGCECVQIFTKSSRQWASKPLSMEEIETFKRNQIKTGITTVIAHDSYLVNLGAPDEQMRTKSVKGMIDELQRCEALGVP